MNGYDGAALRTSSERGHFQVVQYLVAHGADLGQYGERARDTADNEHRPIAMYLHYHMIKLAFN